uniref:Uncharacterized protein n=1 Tax=viral metagenome TaxID=1070528 RepID=A0A6C0C2R3_9ZZZZ
MDKRINQKVELFFQEFKDNVKARIVDKKSPEELIQYIYAYNIIQFEKSDFAKRKRIKNIVPLNDRCNALRANGDQCTRRRKDDNVYCGTHIKGIPHGEITNKKSLDIHKTKKVWAQEIRGIIYYIDKNNNVYNPSDIMNNKTNPGIIAKYTYDISENKYDIPGLFGK